MSIIRYNRDNMTSSLLDIDTRNKIRSLYLTGKEYIQIQAELGINAGTWDNYYYLNKNGFRDFINDVKKEYFIRQAEAFSRKLMSLDETDDARIYALKQKETEFLRETLGKDIYSKKQEIENTQPVTININSLKDRIAESIDNQPKVLQSDVAQSILSQEAQSGNTTTQIDNDVKQLTDTVKPDVV